MDILTKYQNPCPQELLGKQMTGSADEDQQAKFDQDTHVLSLLYKGYRITRSSSPEHTL